LIGIFVFFPSDIGLLSWSDPSPQETQRAQGVWNILVGPLGEEDPCWLADLNREDLELNDRAGLLCQNIINRLDALTEDNSRALPSLKGQ